MSQGKGLGPKEVRWVCSRSYIQQEAESPWPAGPRSCTHPPQTSRSALLSALRCFLSAGDLLKGGDLDPTEI